MYGHCNTKSHSQLKIYTLLITIIICNFFRNTLFCGFLCRWIKVESCLSVEAVAVSVFICGKSNWLVNNPGWANPRHSVQTLSSCCKLYSYQNALDYRVGAGLFEHFKTQWLLYVTWGLAFDNCTLCVRSAFMYISDSKGALPYTAISVWI